MTKASKGVALPADWAPSEDDLDYGRTMVQLSDHQIKSMAEDMRLWAGANANRAVARKAGLKGWSLAFKGWMRREAKKGNGHAISSYAANQQAGFNDAGAQYRPPGNSRPTRDDAILAGMRNVASQMARDRRSKQPDAPLLSFQPGTVDGK